MPYGPNNNHVRNKVLEHTCILLKLLSTEKCTGSRLKLELNIGSKSLTRYLDVLSQQFLVCEDFEADGAHNQRYFYIEKGKGRERRIFDML